MWEALAEASSILSSLKQTTPSDRTSVAGTQGIGDRSEIGKKPWEGQAKLLGNLNGQSRGMEGRLDTQGKKEPELYTSHQGNSQSNNPGTFTPPKYKQMYKERINESANGDNMGIISGKHKATKMTSGSKKTVPGADTNFGGSCNCEKKRKEKKPMTEAQMIGSTVALVASRALTEALNISTNWR